MGAAACSFPAGTNGSPTSANPSPPGGWTGLSQCEEAELATYRCGELTVPLDRSPGRDQDDSRTLDLPVLVGGNLDADRTLLVLTGGPGQPGPALAPRVLPAFAEVADAYRIVMIDQRGTGANALDCPMLQDERGFSDLEVPSVEAVRECAAALGPDREHYATTDTLADLEDLRVALEVEQWAVDGVSYGTYTGQRYAAAHPERVTHLVLDSVIPVTGFDATLTEIFPEYARVMRDVCATPGRDCPGDPADDLAAVLAHEPSLGPDLLDVVTATAYADPSGHFDLPEQLHAAAAGNMGPLREGIEEVTSSGAPADQYSQGVQASTLCQDLTFPWVGAQSPENVRDAQADKTVAGLDQAQLFPFNAETARGNGEMVMCEHWPTIQDESVPASQLSLDGVNALLLAGERDLGTPLLWAERAHADIPGSRLHVVPDAGHSLQVSRRYPEVNTMVAEFLLTQAPDD